MRFPLVMLLQLFNIFSSVNTKQIKKLNPYLLLHRCYHFEPEKGSNKALSLAPKMPQNDVAIFWDLDNSLPKSFPPYEAAVRLKNSVSSFGAVRYMVAYANRHTSRYVPKAVREQRKERELLNQLENRGMIKPVEPYLCRVCGRKFYNNEKLINHFKQIHEREHQKRLNQLESARGKRRLKLVGRYAVKMEKYKNASRDILLTQKVRYSLVDELKRAGVWVRTVSDEPQATDVALREHMVDVMDKRKAECLVLVSDDSDFVDVLEEAKLRCIKTVAVGDTNDGALKRIADARFSWQEILMGKAKKEAPVVVGQWRDRDILKRLEWKYNPVEDKEICGEVNGFDGQDSDDQSDGHDWDVEGIINDADVGTRSEDNWCWWDLNSDSELTSYFDGGTESR